MIDTSRRAGDDVHLPTGSNRSLQAEDAKSAWEALQKCQYLVQYRRITLIIRPEAVSALPIIGSPLTVPKALSNLAIRMLTNPGAKNDPNFQTSNNYIATGNPPRFARVEMDGSMFTATTMAIGLQMSILAYGDLCISTGSSLLLRYALWNSSNAFAVDITS